MTRTLLTWSALVVLLTSLVVAPAASARMDSSARLQMVWPASGTVTSHFGGWRGSRRHDGIDIGMLRTLRLRAVTQGVVRKSGYVSGYAGYGNVVLLALPGGYTALSRTCRRSASSPASGSARASASASPAARAAAPARISTSRSTAPAAP